MFTESPVNNITLNWSDKTILIVEDNLHNYIYLEVILKQTNVKILYAPDGSDAVDIARHHNDIDLILMDIRLPTVSGYDATRQIREFNHLTPIIALTACSMANEKEACLQAGCSDYLSKPVNQKELFSAISRYLTRCNTFPLPQVNEF